MRTVLLLFLLIAGWSSPTARTVAANSLRGLASWIEPTEEVQTTPKTFQIPNPFYLEKK